jgi:DNA-binding transcriptional MerR regulator
LGQLFLNKCIDFNATLSFTVNLGGDEYMAYTVKELAKLSGVTTRTLHYYDEINLLKPAYHGENGYRYYEKEQLLQLQQIMFYRELDLPLVIIQEILSNSDFNLISALESHKQDLSKQADRLQKLMNTIDQTIKHVKGERHMNDEQLFNGFDGEKQKQYEEEIKEKYGEKLLKESKKQTKNWKNDDYSAVQKQYDEIHKNLVVAMQYGHDSSEVQSIIQKHFEVVKQFYTPTKEIYKGLGEMYIEHPDFRKLYDSYHPELANFLAKAMAYYAEKNL